MRIPKTSILLLLSLFPLHFFVRAPKRWRGGGNTMKIKYSICKFRKNVCWEKKFGGGHAPLPDVMCLNSICYSLYIQLDEPRYSLRLKTYCCKFYWSINHWLSFIISPISLHVYWNVCTCDNSINSAWCLFLKIHSCVYVLIHVYVYGEILCNSISNFNKYDLYMY